MAFPPRRLADASPVPLCPALCLGELNHDGTVNATDLGVLLGSWGTEFYDLDGNGTVDAADLAILLGAWGGC